MIVVERAGVGYSDLESSGLAQYDTALKVIDIAAPILAGTITGLIITLSLKGPKTDFFVRNKVAVGIVSGILLAGGVFAWKSWRGKA